MKNAFLCDQVLSWATVAYVTSETCLLCSIKMSLKCFLNSNNFNTFPVNSNNIQEKKISSGYLASKMVQKLNHILKQVVQVENRSGSNQGTDYIANDFFLNLRVFRTKIENLKWQIGRDIIPLSFWKFVTSKVKKLKILRGNKNCEFRYWLHIMLFWNNDFTNFLKVTSIMFLLIYHFQFLS